MSNKFLALISLISTTLVFEYCTTDRAPLFDVLSDSKTNIKFVNTLEKHDQFSILYYLYYYNGGGVGIGDVNNDGLSDIYFTANHKGGNKLYLNKGGFIFEDITSSAGVQGLSDWATGVTMADVNGDGYLDIYVSTISQKYGLLGRNELYINTGDPTSPRFTESAAQYGLDLTCHTTQTAFFDYDKDGDLDCYVLNQSHHPHSNIVDTSNRKNRDPFAGDRLMRNDVQSTGKFTDVSASSGIYQSNLGYGLGVGIGDFNNDGWDDVYIGNDFHENDYYYINQGKLASGQVTFKESGAEHFGHYSRFSMGNDIADFNNDGQLDIITTDMLPPDEKTVKTYGSDENPNNYKVKIEIQGYQKQYSRNCLQMNNGQGVRFSEVALLSGVSATDWSWAPLLVDFDLDGNKDLFVSSGILKRPVDLDYVRFVSDLEIKKNIHQTNKFDDETIEAMPDGSSHPFLFQGSGSIPFKEVSTTWGTEKLKGYFGASAYGDLDNDGDMDLVIQNINAPALVLQNKSSKNHLTFDLKGLNQNTFGVGTKLYLYKNKKIQYQQVFPTRGFQSSCDYKVIFGLDTMTSMDSLVVVWPNQKKQVLYDLAANQQVEVFEKNASDTFIHQLYFPDRPALFQDISQERIFTWSHQENDYLDYNRQYLIPHLLSTRGPRIAVADINQDGKEDLYVCGASGQPGLYLLQNAEGRYDFGKIMIKDKMAFTEEVDAVFFDANQDGFKDLIVLSGGNEFDDGNPALKDNLYLNDGNGYLIQDLTALPEIRKNKSCISHADYDQDGDIDLFIGVLASAKTYGLPQTSYLLKNNGKGKFELADSNTIDLKEIGMVTSAAFEDLNGDGWQDLVVAGEWMPIKIFMNEKGNFKVSSIPNSSGLWQTIYLTDVNQDKLPDILAGNWGKNSKLYSGKNGPLKLYVKDFDKNESIEQIMCYTIDGKEYTFLAKDELERVMPVLKKAYLTYSEVAGKTVDYVLYDLFKDYYQADAKMLTSTCFMNKGNHTFEAVTLPDDLQLAPLFSFNRIPGQGNLLVAGGNFYGTIPYEGRYDALCPTVFEYNQVNHTFEILEKISNMSGEVRDLQWTNGNELIIARNNESLMFYKLNK